jgi:hypothetical protein
LKGLTSQIIRLRFCEVEVGWHDAVEKIVGVAFERIHMGLQGNVRFPARGVDAVGTVRVRKSRGNLLYKAVETFTRGSMAGLGGYKFVRENTDYPVPCIFHTAPTSMLPETRAVVIENLSVRVWETTFFLRTKGDPPFARLSTVFAMAAVRRG